MKLKALVSEIREKMNEAVKNAINEGDDRAGVCLDTNDWYIDLAVWRDGTVGAIVAHDDDTKNRIFRLNLEIWAENILKDYAGEDVWSEYESEAIKIDKTMKYEQLKAKHPDAVLLFRVGDFYEAYEDDAKTCAEVLNLIITRQGKQSIAAFPHTALDSYLPKFIRAGKRVAICDHLDAPKR